MENKMNNQAIVELFKQNFTVYEIAQMCNSTPSAIWAIIKYELS